MEERIPHADWSSLRPWNGFGRKDLGFRAKGKGELVRERGKERKQYNNLWEQSQDSKHVIYNFRSGLSG